MATEIKCSCGAIWERTEVQATERDRPAFQRRLKFPDWCVARPPDSIKRQADARLAALAHDLQPAVTAIEALSDRRRWLSGPAKALHLFRPEQALSGVSFARGFPRPLTRMFGADLRAPDPITKDAPSRWSAHWAITAALAAVGNATRI
jgi:hypothetical protein